MSESNIATCEFPASTHRDVLTSILREGAQQMLATAIEAEVAEWIAGHAHLTDAAGRRQVVRNGYLPKREITTGLGRIEVEQPRVHDRRSPAEREKFHSRILPPYLRKTKSIEELIPWLYLKLSELLKYNLQAVRSHLLREDFQRFWEYVSPGWAAKFLDQWCTRTMRSKIEPMKKVARTLRNHRELILNWFQAKGPFRLERSRGSTTK